MTGGDVPGIVWPPKGVEPATPALRRPGSRPQPWRTPSGQPVLPVVRPPASPPPSLGGRLAAALADARDGMVALGAAAEHAAATVPQLPEGEPSSPVASPARTYVSPPVDTRPGFLGRLRRLLFGEPPQ